MAKKFVPTDEQRRMVKTMSAYGVPQEKISRVLGIHHDTVAKAFWRELEVATVEANAKVAESLFRMATEDKNVTAAIFWLKTRARWKEPKQEVEVTYSSIDEMMERINEQGRDRPGSYTVQ